ncbi:MAG: 5'-nucleotidase C-terminal domain-containing protein [Bacteroidales bacterium]|nr:5'-nucleotidase C-terminal domain-containing protein [Bacteroidales bacterium]
MRRFVISAWMLWTLGTLLTVQAQTFETKEINAQRIEVTSVYDRHPDAAAWEIVAPYKAGVDSVMMPILGETDVEMYAHRPESRLSNWVCDVLREESQRYGKRADIGLCNIGGLRASMPKGIVRVGDIMQIAPFENRFCLVTMKGSDLLELFRQIAKSKGEGISGAQLNITREGELLSATVGDQPVNPKKKYTIATIDYLAEGNDGLTVLRKAVKKVVKPDLVRDVYMERIRREASAGRTIHADLEGRINIEGMTLDQLRDTYEKRPVQKSLLVLHTSDTHSCIMPLSSNSDNKFVADKAGYLRRCVLIDDFRASDPDLLLIDCGDFSQGSAYYNLYKGDVEVKLMNHMCYDAATIGNHEFDFGIDNMARLFRMAQFPIVCCNYDFTGTVLQDLVKPYVIVEKKGLRIGLIGVCPKLEGLVSEKNCPGVIYRDPVECAQPIADKLKNEDHCDLVFVLSHLGYTRPLNGGMYDLEFIPAMHNIDAVFGGHSHTYFKEPKYFENADGKKIPLNHMGKNAQFVGVMNFELEEK